MLSDPIDGAAPWLSAHLFFHATLEDPVRPGDRVLLDVVEPFVRACRERGWIRRYFFIRYNELGPHIRLRLQAEAEVLEASVRPALAEAAGLLDEPSADAAGIIHPSRHPLLDHVRWIAYQPEVERYAGSAGVEAAEELFQASSDAALALLRQETALGAEARSAKALLALVVLLHCMSEDPAHATTLARKYSDDGLDLVRHRQEREGGEPERWSEVFAARNDRQPPALRATIRALWTAMDAGEALPGPWDVYGDRLREVRRRLDGLRTTGALTQGGAPLRTWREVAEVLVPSYLHMMSNRLGIFVLEEAYLGDLAARLLADGAEAPFHQPDP